MRGRDGGITNTLKINDEKNAARAILQPICDQKDLSALIRISEQWLPTGYMIIMMISSMILSLLFALLKLVLR